MRAFASAFERYGREGERKSQMAEKSAADEVAQLLLYTTRGFSCSVPSRDVAAAAAAAKREIERE